MSASHTPGPWSVGDAGATVFGPPNGKPWTRDTYKANARLIAAAPELLAALEAIADVPANQDVAVIVKLARAAIAKVQS